MGTRKKRRVFSQDFKKQVVYMYESGISRKEVIEKYDLTPSAFDKWVQQYKNLELGGEELELTSEQKELINLRRELEILRKEKEILKKAALIFGKND